MRTRYLWIIKLWELEIKMKNKLEVLIMNNIDFQTPHWVCEIIVGLIEGNPKSILEPTAGAGNLVKAIDKGYPSSIVYTPTDFFNFDKEVDCIVGNPPFTPMKTGYDILNRCFELSDNIVILMPWLALINSQKRTQLYMEKGLKEIVHLPRKAFPGSRVQTCVLVFKKQYNGDIIFNTV